jgi:hypothetical protein
MVKGPIVVGNGRIPVLLVGVDDASAVEQVRVPEVKVNGLGHVNERFLRPGTKAGPVSVMPSARQSATMG